MNMFEHISICISENVLKTRPIMLLLTATIPTTSNARNQIPNCQRNGHAHNHQSRPKNIHFSRSATHSFSCLVGILSEQLKNESRICQEVMKSIVSIGHDFRDQTPNISQQLQRIKLQP